MDFSAATGAEVWGGGPGKLVDLLLPL